MSKNVPEIRLCGEWLKKLGFVQGRKVIITPMNELLIVRLESENKLANEIS
ncbi:SymE family type I addiction module toxin [Pedobacter sp.]|uniref:SymE family type I addiction module toxin n=1 Tax=Pedobacter sp. TaxID=1411316 RepID=UPI0039C8EE48